MTVVLLHKGNGGFWGVGMVKVLWKTVLGFLNLQLMSVIFYHDTLHGFWEGQGTRTASLEAKLPQKLVSIREEFLYEIFLDLHKDYKALD